MELFCGTLLSMVVRMTLTIMVVHGFDHYFGLFLNFDLVESVKRSEIQIHGKSELR